MTEQIIIKIDNGIDSIDAGKLPDVFSKDIEQAFKNGQTEFKVNSCISIRILEFLCHESKKRLEYHLKEKKVRRNTAWKLFSSSFKKYYFVD